MLHPRAKLFVQTLVVETQLSLLTWLDTEPLPDVASVFVSVIPLVPFFPLISYSVSRGVTLCSDCLKLWTKNGFASLSTGFVFVTSCFDNDSKFPVCLNCPHDVKFKWYFWHNTKTQKTYRRSKMNVETNNTKIETLVKVERLQSSQKCLASREFVLIFVSLRRCLVREFDNLPERCKGSPRRFVGSFHSLVSRLCAS